MAITGLYNIPQSPEELSTWAFIHQAHHIDINAAIYNQLLIALPMYQLDPFKPDDQTSIKTWLYQHQLMHQNQDKVLGIAGFDLTDVEWQDIDQLAGWIEQNAQEHYTAGNLLGIG